MGKPIENNLTLMTIKDTIEYLKISESQLRVLVRKKQIPNFRIGNRIYFNLNSINEWIKVLEDCQKKKMLFI